MAPRTRRFAPALPTIFLLMLGMSSPLAARNINWSGYDWWVRSSNGAPQGPGPNIFSDSTENVFVDEQGDLHLRITQREDGKWVAAEVDLHQSLGYGTYEWELSSRYDQWAPNVVGGLFTYISPQSVANQTDGEVGNGVADTPHEIDIEFTGAWGNGHLYFTTHDPDVQSPSKNFYQVLNGDYTTHRFKWEQQRITWESYNGHVAGVASPAHPIVEQRPGPSAGVPARHVYEGPVVPQDLNEIPIINFWLSDNNAANNGPTNGQPQELIIHSFRFTPLGAEPVVPGDYDGDGEVSVSDYQRWRETYGSETLLDADGNGDGVVNAADFTVWRDNAERQTPGPSSIVPEPAAYSALLPVALGRLATHRGPRR